MEIEAILDRRLGELVSARRIVEISASEIGDRYDWWPIAARVAALMEEPLFAAGVPRRKTSGRRPSAPREPAAQMAFGVDRPGEGGG